MKREEALGLLKSNVKSPNMINHCLASEAVMRALARKLGEDEEKWGLAGLLHDLDVELTNADLSTHGLKSEEILRQNGLPEDLIEAVKLHNEKAHGIKRTARFHHALACAETITGLITATTMVYPDKKLASVKPKSVTKRMKEKNFAASVDRGIIMECEKIGLTIESFSEMALRAMAGIAPQLGL